MNAEIISEYYVTEKTAEDYHKVLDTNVIGPAICAREAIQSMKKRGVDGYIVNINSIAGHYAETIMIPMGMYCPSKYALTALATELRHEIAIADLNIKITNISPGAVSIDMQRDIFKKETKQFRNTVLE